MNDNPDPLRGPVVDLPSPTCDLCEREAVTETMIVNEANGLTAVADLCKVHLDTLERYNCGDDVTWETQQ